MLLVEKICADLVASQKKNYKILRFSKKKTRLGKLNKELSLSLWKLVEKPKELVKLN